MFWWILLPISFFYTLIYFTIVRPYRIWKNLPIAHVHFLPHHLKLTDFLRGRRNIVWVYDDVYKSFPHEPYVGLYEIRQPVLLVRDPELVNAILIKDFDYFQNRGMRSRIANADPLEAHLLYLCGNEWKNTRAKVTTLFSPGKLRRMFTFVEDCVADLEAHMRPYAITGRPADLKDIMLKYNTDVMGKYAFGLEFNTLKDPDSKYLKLHHDNVSLSLPRIGNILLRFVHPKLLQWFPIGLPPADNKKFHLELIRDAVEHYRSDTKWELNFLKSLIDIQNQEKQKRTPEADALSDTLLAANLKLLFVSGIETSANALSCCLYELALHPDIQEKVRKEIKTVTESSELNFEMVCNGLPYLEMVISETLRKHPPTTITSRICNLDYTLPGTTTQIKKGTRIMIPIYSLHNDSKYYETPEKFIPERFENFEKLSKPYLPFGDGPRICPGKKLAKDEIKYCLARLLLKFSFAPTDRTEIPLQIEERAVFFSPKNGIILSVQEIVD